MDARYFIDCEFDGHGGPLLSVAMVREDGFSLHVTTKEKAKDPWVIENVVPLLDKHEADVSATADLNGVGNVIRYFIGNHVKHVRVAADSPVDIGRFCAAISTAPDGGWASTDYPLLTFEVHNVDCYPTTVPNAVQHNAWWDAMALRAKLASAGEAGTAETTEIGSVHEHATAEGGDAP